MKLFSGSSHTGLAGAIAEIIGIPLSSVERKKFSGGENYVRYTESVRGQDIFIVQTATQNVNDDVLELCLLCQAAKLGFAKSVRVVLPHMPYARQDRVAKPREPISARLIATMLEAAGADHIITLDLHSEQLQGFFRIPVDALTALPIIRDYIASKKLPDLTIVSPDAGGAKRAKQLADALGAELAIIHKSRPAAQQVELIEAVGRIKGRTCVIFDDMIDTAGSLQSTVQTLRDRGANTDLYAATIHGVLSGQAEERLVALDLKEIIVTNTIPCPIFLQNMMHLSVANLLATVMQRIVTGESVTNAH